MLWQADSSDRGRDFAATHAEAIFAVHPNVERMREYTDDLNFRLETRFNRPKMVGDWRVGVWLLANSWAREPHSPLF